MVANRSSILRRLAVLMASLSLMAVVPVAEAEVYTHMKVDGIPGESRFPDKWDWIDLTGFSQSFGTTDCALVVARKRIDRASPLLIGRAAANQMIPSVVITMRNSGEGQRDFFTATLGLVLVDRIELADQNGELVERVVLAPRTITIEYKPQSDKGGLGAPVVTSVSCNPSKK